MDVNFFDWSYLGSFTGALVAVTLLTEMIKALPVVKRIPTQAIRKKPDLVNDVWFGDHHQFDVFVLDRRGRAVRPWLTAWYDIGSGVLVGWCISTNPNSETIAESFIRAVAAKPDSPIHGAPNAIYIDNGKDYRSHAFEGEPKVASPEGLQVGTGASTASARIEDSRLGADAESWQGRDPDMMDAMYLQMVGASTLQAMHVKVVHAKAYHGWAKPVERFFRTLQAQASAKSLEAQARVGAPWQDRTGAARGGITGRAERRGAVFTIESARRSGASF